MNKKFYEAPAFEEVEVLIQSNLLAGSGPENNEADIVDDDATETGGW